MITVKTNETQWPCLPRGQAPLEWAMDTRTDFFRPRGRGSKLSPQDKARVIALRAEGKTNSEIAVIFDRDPSTIQMVFSERKA